MPDPIISRHDLGQHLGRGDTLDTDEAALAAVDAASEVCRTTAEQVFNRVTEDVIVFDGPGTDVILLPEGPVEEVTSVQDPDSEELVEDDDWVLTRIGTLIRVGGVWTKGRQNFQVTYTHGYADEDLPRDVRMVALTLAARLYMQGPAVFETLGNRQVRYAGPPMDLSATEKAILRKHKRT